MKNETFHKNWWICPEQMSRFLTYPVWVCVYFHSCFVFRISYYTYWSTHHWRDIKGQCQFYWMQTKQQANWSVYELLRHFICSQSHLTNVHGVLRWTGGPSRVYFILAPSIPRWGSRTMATLTRMKHLLKSECGSWQQQSTTQQSCLYISRLIFAGLQPLLLLGNNNGKAR